MSTPTPASRDRDQDLKTLSLRVVKCLFSGNDDFSSHVQETPDLLVSSVEMALGVSFRVNWSTVTDEELPAIKAWQDYCISLFDSVEAFVTEAVGR